MRPNKRKQKTQMSGTLTSEPVLLNEIANESLRNQHKLTLEMGEESPFHHFKVKDQTVIDRLYLHKSISEEQHWSGTRYSEIVYKSGAFSGSQSFEYKERLNKTPDPPLRCMVLSKIDGYLREKDPNRGVILWKSVAYEIAPTQKNELKKLGLSLDCLADYFYGRPRKAVRFVLLALD